MPIESSNVNCSNSDVDVGTDSVEQRVPREAPPPPYSPPAPGSAVIVTDQPSSVVQQTVIIQVPLKDNPIYYTCYNCMDRVYTKVKHVNSRKTHLMAGFICGCTFWCLMCCLGLIPYVVKTFKKTEHYCPHCNTLLGTYSKI